MAQKTGAKKVQRAELARQAVELRARGLTLDQIAKAIGHKNKSSVYRLIEAELEKVPVEKIEHLRKIEVAKCDRLERRLDAFIEPPTAREPNDGYDPDRALEAMGRMLKVMERRAKLLGLDAPSKSEVTGHLTRTITDESIENMNLEELAEVVADRGKDR